MGEFTVPVEEAVWGRAAPNIILTIRPNAEYVPKFSAGAEAEAECLQSTVLFHYVLLCCRVCAPTNN